MELNLFPLKLKIVFIVTHNDTKTVDYFNFSGTNKP